MKKQNKKTTQLKDLRLKLAESFDSWHEKNNDPTMETKITNSICNTYNTEIRVKKHNQDKTKISFS